MIKEGHTSPRELSTKEAAQLLDLAPDTLRRWRSTGERHLRWIKRFRKVYYLESDVVEFKENNTETGSPYGSKNFVP